MTCLLLAAAFMALCIGILAITWAGGDMAEQVTAPRLDLGELRRLHEAATPGPWEWIDGDTDKPWDAGDPDQFAPSLRTAWTKKSQFNLGELPVWILNIDQLGDNKNDAALIAAMRNALPALLSIWEAAEEFMDERDSDYPDPKEMARMLIGLRAALAAVRKEET
jgi:hypothetical protein